MMSHICPWCNEEVPLRREYADSDPSFIFFMNCSNCSIRRGEQGFWWELNQSDEYCGFVIKLRLSERGVLKLSMDLRPNNTPSYTLESHTELDRSVGVEVLLSKEGEITPEEAKALLLKYKKLWVFA